MVAGTERPEFEVRTGVRSKARLITGSGSGPEVRVRGSVPSGPRCGCRPVCVTRSHMQNTDHGLPLLPPVDQVAEANRILDGINAKLAAALKAESKSAAIIREV